jgi:hypothetical protein
VTEENVQLPDMTALTGSPTSLRATAAAMALLIQGQRPSLSEVARLAGVSRQALLKDHKMVAEFVAQLRASWQAPPTSPTGKIEAELGEARSKLRAERERRVRAEHERDRALHHLQLAEATLHAQGDSHPRVLTLPFGSR